MYDSLGGDPTDSDAAYEIVIRSPYEPDRIMRFHTYREAYAHSYRNNHTPIHYTDRAGTRHLCGHVNGQEIYKGHDPKPAKEVA